MQSACAWASIYSEADNCACCVAQRRIVSLLFMAAPTFWPSWKRGHRRLHSSRRSCMLALKPNTPLRAALWSIATEAAAASRPTAAAGLQHTFLADVRLCGGCVYFELQVIERIGDLQFGFCTEFEPRKDAEGEGAGAMARGRGLWTAFG